MSSTMSREVARVVLTSHGPDRPDDWREQAECKDDPIPDLWFVPPGDRHGIAAAKAICHRCPVAAECLAEAMADPSIVGVWGGTGENERAKLRVTMPRQPKGIQHGTPGGHRTHRGGPVSEPPVTKYELTVKIRGNTHDEIEDELRTLVHGGYLLDSDYGKRDAWNATGGRCTSVMVHTNPEQTPEAYAAELDAYTTTWWNERRLVEDAPEPEDPDADLIRVMSDAIGGSASWADDARSALAALREAGYSVTRDRDAQEAGR